MITSFEGVKDVIKFMSFEELDIVGFRTKTHIESRSEHHIEKSIGIGELGENKSAVDTDSIDSESEHQESLLSDFGNQNFKKVNDEARKKRLRIKNENKTKNLLDLSTLVDKIKVKVDHNKQINEQLEKGSERLSDAKSKESTVRKRRKSKRKAEILLPKTIAQGKQEFSNLTFEKSINGISTSKQYADNLNKFVNPDTLQIDLSPENIDRFLSKHWIELMEVCYDLIQEIFFEVGNIQVSEDIQVLLKHLKSISNRGVTDYFFDNLFNKQKLHLDQNWFKYKDRIETLEKQKSELKREIEEVNELMMGMSDNSRSLTSGQGRSRHRSIDPTETQKDTSRNVGSDLKNNDTADFAKHLPKEQSTEKPMKGVSKIMTLRSKIDDESNTALIEDSKKDPIKQEDENPKIGRKVSVRSKKDGDIKMSERFTSQHSNQETPEDSNFYRTNSKASNPKMLTSKKSLVFMRSKNKMSMKEELQMMQDIKDLEKEKDTLVIRNKELQSQLSASQKETIKWKFIMSQKIIELEDRIDTLKNTHNTQKHMLKEDYSKDLIKISRLSKKKEEITIS